MAGGILDTMVGIPRAATKAMNSVVVVCDSKFDDDYCSGFVAVKARTAPDNLQRTLVIAPLKFVMEAVGRCQCLSVCFFDGVESPASVVAEEEWWCLLSTPHHSRCEAVTWMKDDCTPSRFTPCRTFMMPPNSHTSFYYQPTYANVECTKSYLEEDYNKVMIDSGNYFLVACDYFEETSGGLSKLTGGPVFTMDNGMAGETMGIVLQYCQIMRLEKDRQIGNEIRVAVTSTHFKKIMKKLEKQLDTPRRKLTEQQGLDTSPSPPPRRKRREQQGQRILSGGVPFLSGGKRGGRGGRGRVQKRKR